MWGPTQLPHRAKRRRSREVDVLSHLAAGRSNCQIAEAMYLSVRTVEKHVERLLMKTD
ncbi:response regulator transcription factor [Ferrithrix thermotolerans]|uniref:response regulator transcription factor n=1 Tax=Ferrithrix thermotolerans TaxID=209649 RepID=UPI001C4A4342|nr:LuxR C-terminal-related transcriptional regulator [Ferrithrix thermotolerans]